MSITREQILEAQRDQHAAAQDNRQQVRLVAGPGTGKSYAIEERVRWLIEQRTASESIHVVSFTRASSRNLRERVHRYCEENRLPEGSRVGVTTLHSLALRVLRRAGLLQAYPDNPLVLDRWEQKQIFDAEFSLSTSRPPKRCKEIRTDHEAFWSTNEWGPPNYIPPNPPISPTERNQFNQFHGPRSQLYSCVLPGEIVRQCVQHIESGTLDPANLLSISHLIVDEYQDLNPNDITFIDSIAESGVTVFVAGDDDQSIYSFRFASPSGIQSFPARYPAAGVHTLRRCFRSTPAVLRSAICVVNHNTLPERIPKSLSSLYEHSDPPVQGRVLGFRYQNAGMEARAIAISCRRLVDADIQPSEILILLSDTRILSRLIYSAIDDQRLSYTPIKGDSLIDNAIGRCIYCLVRLVCNRKDYVAHRAIMALQPRVGVRTCNSIANKTLRNNLNFCALFYSPIPQGIFSLREIRAIEGIRTVATDVSAWHPENLIIDRAESIGALLSQWYGDSSQDYWNEITALLPDGFCLDELRDYLAANTDEQQAGVLKLAYDRLGLQAPEQGFLPPRVRIMTMHNSKGLSAKIVFIPGLEEEVFPGAWRRSYPGLILEGARLLYVSMTRARVACILSQSRNRTIYGTYRSTAPSRFSAQTGITFVESSDGLNIDDVADISTDIRNL